MADKKENRLGWSKISIPMDFSDLLYMMAKKAGYSREDIHLYLYHLLKTSYPEDTAQLTKFLELDWMQEPPEQDE
jgi:hypothetical protein